MLLIKLSLVMFTVLYISGVPWFSLLNGFHFLFKCILFFCIYPSQINIGAFCLDDLITSLDFSNQPSFSFAVHLVSFRSQISVTSYGFHLLGYFSSPAEHIELLQCNCLTP